MDQAIFNTQNSVGGYFGNYYLYSSDDLTEEYVAFINTTSQDATAIFGQYIH